MTHLQSTHAGKATSDHDFDDRYDSWFKVEKHLFADAVLTAAGCLQAGFDI